MINHNPKNIFCWLKTNSHCYVKLNCMNHKSAICTEWLKNQKCLLNMKDAHFMNDLKSMIIWWSHLNDLRVSPSQIAQLERAKQEALAQTEEVSHHYSSIIVPHWTFSNIFHFTDIISISYEYGSSFFGHVHSAPQYL